ncbi:hypothetical protein IGI04_030046 [Brassica rapa subsp. trilocularis]|uniref:Uncharacterized protein n=1 Tax=Brassica rapa subsp. trilocularis TaxID=1813537 RepID=A0ABQ7LR56_BRACM|nr:hypothetical protein IGI04_030046 [Brassica rapa subsp. trilocularis]
MDTDTRGHDQNIKEKPCTCTRSRKYKGNKDKGSLGNTTKTRTKINHLGDRRSRLVASLKTFLWKTQRDKTKG